MRATRKTKKGLFERANEQWEAGHVRSAFRLFLAAAKAGDSGAQVDLGNFYLDGIGVNPNRDAALHWYRRAYREGDPAGANNIGVLYRNENQFARAVKWLERAIKLGDPDAHLEIAKIHLRPNGDREKAIHHLKRLLAYKRDRVTEAYRHEGRLLLQRLKLK